MERNYSGEIKKFYDLGLERNRLDQDFFLLDAIRSKAIIERYLHGKKMNILDVGGGAGYYAFWLTGLGHLVTLTDLSPRHIALVKEQEKNNGVKLHGVMEGNAIALDLPDAHFDLVLQLGPLYHLVDSGDRVRALSEAGRVLKPGGFLLSAIISRYASLFDGFKRDLINDPVFEKLVEDDLKNGVHRNYSGDPEYFTTAYFHTPDEIIREIEEAGLLFEKLIAIESFGWIPEDFSSRKNDPAYMKRLLKFISLVESDAEIMAMSPHIMAVSQRK